VNNELFKILSRMNGGSILSGQADDFTRKNLFSDAASLFIDEMDNKYYFFAEYIIDGESDNFYLIQEATIRNKEAFGDEKVNPSDAYLIMFWKVDEINESIYSKVIKFEEDEMFYKKYLIYYTEEELNALISRLDEYKEPNLKKIIEDISTKEKLDDAWKLAIRIMTKIPFWNMEFPSAVMEDFEEKVEKSISRTTKNIDTNALLELKAFIDNEKCVADDLADKIITKYLGDFS